MYRVLNSLFILAVVLTALFKATSAQSAEELANNGNEDPNIHPFDRAANVFIIRLQEGSTPALDGFMKFISFLGLGVLYLVVAAIYWLCIDRTLGIMMVFIALMVTWVNQFTKLAASFPRPFWQDPDVRAIECSGTTFGLPSGHGAAPLAILGVLAIVLTKRYARKEPGAPSHWWKLVLLWFFIFAWAFVTSLARLYTGAHYAIDLIVGIGQGLVILGLFFACQWFVIPWLYKIGWRGQLITVAVTTAVMIAVVIGSLYVSYAKGIPELWYQNYVRQCGTDGWRPQQLVDTGLIVGLFFGLFSGHVLASRFCDWQASKPKTWWKRFVLRPLWFLIPAAVPVVPLIPAFTPMNEFSPLLAFFVVFIACAIAALWASFVGPYIAKHHIEKKYAKQHAWLGDWVVTREEVEKQGREQTAETARDRDEPPTVDNV